MKKLFLIALSSFIFQDLLSITKKETRSLEKKYKAFCKKHNNGNSYEKFKDIADWKFTTNKKKNKVFFVKKIFCNEDRTLEIIFNLQTRNYTSRFLDQEKSQFFIPYDTTHKFPLADLLYTPVGNYIEPVYDSIVKMRVVKYSNDEVKKINPFLSPLNLYFTEKGKIKREASDTKGLQTFYYTDIEKYSLFKDLMRVLSDT